MGIRHVCFAVTDQVGSQSHWPVPWVCPGPSPTACNTTSRHDTSGWRYHQLLKSAPKTEGILYITPKNHWTCEFEGVWMCIAGVLGSPNHQFWDPRILRVVLGCFFFFVLGDGKKWGISTVSVDCKHRSQFSWLFIDKLGGNTSTFGISFHQTDWS